MPPHRCELLVRFLILLFIMKMKYLGYLAVWNSSVHSQSHLLSLRLKNPRTRGTWNVENKIVIEVLRQLVQEVCEWMGIFPRRRHFVFSFPNKAVAIRCGALFFMDSAFSTICLPKRQNPRTQERFSGVDQMGSACHPQTEQWRNGSEKHVSGA